MLSRQSTRLRLREHPVEFVLTMGMGTGQRAAFATTIVIGALSASDARATDPDRVEWSDDWGVGALSGYVLPSVLHHGFGHGRPVGEIHVGELPMLPTPQMYARGGGLGMVGTF